MSRDGIQRLLPEDEPVLYEGRPHGYLRPGWSEVLSYAAMLGMGLFMVAMAWWSVRNYPTTSWELGWGTIQFKGTQGASTSSAGMPSPLAWIVLIAILELYRQASASSLRIVLTPRRVLTSRGVFRTRIWAFHRTGGEEVHASSRGIQLWSPDGALNMDLRGFDTADAEGIRTAFETHDPQPPPPLPPVLITWRRVALVSVVLLLGFTVIGWWRGTRQPVSLELIWVTGTPPRSDQLDVRIEGPYWVERHLRLVKTEVLDESGTRLNSNSGGGGGGTGLFRTYRSSHEAIPRGPQRVRVRVSARWVGPDYETPIEDPRRFRKELAPGEFEVVVQRGEELDVTLREDAKGWLTPVKE